MQAFPYTSIIGMTDEHQKVILRQLILLKQAGFTHICIDCHTINIKKDIDVAIEYVKDRLGIPTAVDYLKLQAILESWWYNTSTVMLVLLLRMMYIIPVR